MVFLGHTFGSLHARRSIKGSIDARDHAVSKKGLSQNFGSLDWRPGPVKISQNIKNTPILGAPPKRTTYPNKKMFLIVSRRLVASAEGLNSSIAIAPAELQPKTCKAL